MMRQSASVFLGAATLAVGCLASAALAQQEPEVIEGAQATVTLYPFSFLREDELTILRQIAQSAPAREALLGEGGGYAAVAVAPLEGFFRDGAPVESAVALTQLPDAESAREDALASCDAARSTEEPCVVLMEVAPGV